MKKDKMALFEHELCGCKFFAEINRESYPSFNGRCPNPSCEMHVLLFAKELFPSADHARRAYIRAIKADPQATFWQAISEDAGEKAA